MASALEFLPDVNVDEEKDSSQLAIKKQQEPRLYHICETTVYLSLN